MQNPDPYGPKVIWYVPKRRPSLARRKYDFLRCLLRWGTISEAAARIGVDRRTIQRWRLDDPGFDEGCRIRLEWRREAIILAVSDRLAKPTRRPMFRGSREVGHLARADDKVLRALLKTIAPPRSRRSRVAAGLTNVAPGATSPVSVDGDSATDAKG